MCSLRTAVVAGLLNATAQPHDRLVGRVLGGWTVLSVAALLFFRGQHVGWTGLAKSWCGYLLLWVLVLGRSLQSRSLQAVCVWLLAQAGLLLYLILWYGLLAFVGHRSSTGLGNTREWTKALPPGFLRARARRRDRERDQEESACCLASAATA